jgi:uncharacterized membrane protein YfcA
MTNAFMLWLFAVSLGASALGGLLGMASGVFIVPILVTFGRVDLRTAIVASIVSVIACSCGGAAAFLRERLTSVRLAIVLEVATTLGALTGVFLFGIIPVAILFALLSVVLVLSGWQMLANRHDRSAVDVSAPGRWPALDMSYPDRALGREIAYRVERLPLGMALMYGAGLISALLGIGSGVLKIPAMDTALRLPLKVSSATSNFMIGVTAAASGAAYFVRGLIPADIAGPVALGSVIGAALGAKAMRRVSDRKLRFVFAGLLILLALQMMLKAFGIELGGVEG